MRVYDLNVAAEQRGSLVSAKVAWEDNDRPQTDLYFRVGLTPEELPGDCADSFLLTTAIIAFRNGERRLSLDRPICPRLKDNHLTTLSYLNSWFWYRYERQRSDPIDFRIEAPERAAKTQASRRSGAFFSGGVDSLDLIYRNHRTYPEDHPFRIKDAVFVHGFDLGYREPLGDELEFFDYIVECMQPVLRDADLRLIPAYTNLRSLERDNQCWHQEYQSSALGAVAQLFSQRLDRIYMASSFHVSELRPFGSHPILDHHQSSADLELIHDGERLYRYDKMLNIAKWPEALECLRVCFWGEVDRLNCGQCEKCIRTKIDLLCAGVLDQATSLPGNDITADEIAEHMALTTTSVRFVPMMIKRLTAIGRDDLAAALAKKRQRFRFSRLGNFKQAVKSFDQRFLGGTVKRRMKGRGSPYPPDPYPLTGRSSPLKE